MLYRLIFDIVRHDFYRIKRRHYGISNNFNVCSDAWIDLVYATSTKKQAQERQNQLNAIEKGDEVVTIGGMFAIVDEVDTTAKKIVLDVDGVFLTFELPAIKRIVTKATTETTLVETEETSVVNEPAVETVDSTDTDSAIESH